MYMRMCLYMGLHVFEQIVTSTKTVFRVKDLSDDQPYNCCLIFFLDFNFLEYLMLGNYTILPFSI